LYIFNFLRWTMFASSIDLVRRRWQLERFISPLPILSLLILTEKKKSGLVIIIYESFIIICLLKLIIKKCSNFSYLCFYVPALWIEHSIERWMYSLWICIERFCSKLLQKMLKSDPTEALPMYTYKLWPKKIKIPEMVNIGMVL